MTVLGWTVRTEEGLEIAVEAGYLGRRDEGNTGPARDRSFPELPVKAIDTGNNIRTYFKLMLGFGEHTSQYQCWTRQAWH